MFGHKHPPLLGLEIETIYGRKKVKGILRRRVDGFHHPGSQRVCNKAESFFLNIGGVWS